MELIRVFEWSPKLQFCSEYQLVSHEGRFESISGRIQIPVHPERIQLEICLCPADDAIEINGKKVNFLPGLLGIWVKRRKRPKNGNQRVMCKLYYGN